MKHQDAYKLVKKYQFLLYPACERIMPVGSIRRADENVLHKGVRDIEFLIIPKRDVQTDMFGQALSEQPESQLDILLRDLKDSGAIAEPKIARKADGPKFKKFAIPGCDYMEGGARKEFCLELWIVTERTWGIQSVLRTGPREFSYCFVNSEKFVGFHKASGKRLRGLLPHYYEYIAGETKIIVRGTRNEEHPELEEVIDLPTEADAIRLLGLNASNNYWIEPNERYLYIREEK